MTLRAAPHILRFGPVLLALLTTPVALCVPAPPTPPAPTLPDIGAPAPDAVSGGASPFFPEAAAPSARDLEIAELPFLVTEPPAAEQPLEESLPAPITGSADALNPFAPLLSPQVPPPEVAEEPVTPVDTAQEAPAAPEIVEIPVPPEPPAPPIADSGVPERAVSVPAPAPRLPTTPRTLTRSLTTDTTADTTAAADADGTPGVLTRHAGNSASAWAGVLAEVAVSRPPAPTLGAPVAQRLGPADGSSVVGTPAPEPAAPSAQAGMQTDLQAGTEAQGPRERARATLSPPTPLNLSRSSGAEEARRARSPDSGVGRYLSERRVSFTAMSTGTGVFRTQESEKPILLAVGEALPGSDVVLVELSQNAAAFAQGSQADVRHTLALRP